MKCERCGKDTKKPIMVRGPLHPIRVGKECAKHYKRVTQKDLIRKTLDKTRIEDDTPILPHIVADSVVGEIEQLSGKRIQNRKIAIDWLADRANTVYQTNERFRKQIRGRENSGLGTLYSFMRHWLSSWMLKNDHHVYESIPRFKRDQFANGLPIA